MTAVVIDASVALSWLLDETLPSNLLDLAQSIGKGTVLEAPVLLRYEVANVLVTSHTRRNRLSNEGLLSALQDFENLPIRYDSESSHVATGPTSQIASDMDLSVYDAAYLELALRKGRHLATNDKRMKEAAARLGVGAV